MVQKMGRSMSETSEESGSFPMGRAENPVGLIYRSARRHLPIPVRVLNSADSLNPANTVPRLAPRSSTEIQ